ncbi:MAG: hypothetical protein M0Z81_14440 [Deltaproteobacteria bacterium]|nr:hypothetical protein [Deltaproteobacteria bacterium]
MFIDVAKHVGDIAKRHLLVESLSFLLVIISFRPAPGKRFTLGVVLQVLKLSLLEHLHPHLISGVQQNWAAPAGSIVARRLQC